MGALSADTLSGTVAVVLPAIAIFLARQHPQPWRPSSRLDDHDVGIATALLEMHAG